MDIDQFWGLVDRVHVASGGDMDRKCQLLGEALHAFPAVQVASFDEHFGECLRRGFSEDLWGAAYLICGGCGDDSFVDFRSTLISLGKASFEAALDHPDSLADSDLDRNSAYFEGYQYIAQRIYEQMTGQEMPFRKPPSAKLSGKPIEEWAMSPRYPKLVLKFGHNDAKHLHLRRERGEAGLKNHALTNLTQLLLDSGIISAGGLIPPLRVMRNALRVGVSPVDGLTWTPFELQEGDYWNVVVRLESLKAEDLKNWAGDKPTKLRQDTTASKSEDFSDWIRGLKERGLG